MGSNIHNQYDCGGDFTTSAPGINVAAVLLCNGRVMYIWNLEHD